MADFRSAGEWDPSVRSAKLLSDGDPVRLGARFAINANGIPLKYETTEFVQDEKVVLYAKQFAMVSLDTITVVPREDGGSDMTYHATINLRGVFRVFTPVLEKGFQKLGDAAKEGLIKHLGELR